MHCVDETAPTKVGTYRNTCVQRGTLSWATSA
jgi:hypothetical protein